MPKYRDELIQTIKLMGQELIDRAESMVHDDCEMITNFNINIDIPQPMDGPPELTWSTSVVSKNFWEKQIGHSIGEAKQEIQIESVTVEKKHGHWDTSYDPFEQATSIKCSECGFVTNYEGQTTFPHECPNCKAVMEDEF